MIHVNRVKLQYKGGNNRIQHKVGDIVVPLRIYEEFGVIHIYYPNGNHELYTLFNQAQLSKKENTYWRVL